MPDARKTFTLAQLREFADSERHKLACDDERRGFWAGERDRHDFFVAVMALVDRLSGDSTIVDRLRGAERSGRSPPRGSAADKEKQGKGA